MGADLPDGAAAQDGDAVPVAPEVMVDAAAPVVLADADNPHKSKTLACCAAAQQAFFTPSVTFGDSAPRGAPRA